MNQHRDDSRLALLLGKAALTALEQKHVTVIGLGGVGSWAAEALVRSGIGRITIADNDLICPSNINRQVQAMPGAVGLPKAEVLLERLREINPRCKAAAITQIFSKETANLFGLENTDYIIDAIDTLPHKIDLIMKGTINPVPQSPILFSCMGMAQKLDPTRIKTADIWNTRNCPLARLVRQELRKRGYTGHFTAVYSDEQPKRREEIFFEQGSAGKKAINNPAASSGVCCLGKVSDSGFNTQDSAASRGVLNPSHTINGSIVTVTAAAGMILASLVIRDILQKLPENPAGGGSAVYG